MKSRWSNDVADSWRKAKAQRRAQSEHVGCIAMGIGEVLEEGQICFVVARAIEYVKHSGISAPRMKAYWV